MALVVEDGTGRTDADSYGSLADANTYHTAYTAGTTWSSASDPDKERALRSATQYLDSKYGDRFLGDKRTLDQALAWPRIGAEVDGGVIAENVVPLKVRQATFELAVRALVTPLDTDYQAGALTSSRKKVGPLEVENKYEAGGQSPTKIYSTVRGLVSGLIGGQEMERM